MIIVPAEYKVGAEIEVLLPAVACDVRRVLTTVPLIFSIATRCGVKSSGHPRQME
jgi:hypothetical protein